MHASPFPPLPELLRRTEEKREERRKERLDDYYRRNYGDYLSFQVGRKQLAGSSWLAVGAAVGSLDWAVRAYLASRLPLTLLTVVAGGQRSGQ